MPARIQSYRLGLGSAKQAAIGTASTTHNRFRKLDMDIPTLRYGTETDKDEVGKGHEFISGSSGVFPTAWDISGRIEKFGSAEFTAWAWGYALGAVGYATSTYTIYPIDAGTTLELPYFSIVAQLPEGGSTAVDETYLDCVIEDVETTFKYGPGRASVRTVANFVGTGQHTIPSGVVLDPAIDENYMLSSSASVTINGIDYVAGTGSSGTGRRTILQGTLGWKNNCILGLRYYPGSGTTSGAAVGGRILIGNRVPTLTFTVFLEHDSTELAKLIAQTSGTAVIGFTYDATHYVTWTFDDISFVSVDRTTEEGLVGVTVTAAVKAATTGSSGAWGITGLVKVVSKNDLTDIAQ